MTKKMVDEKLKPTPPPNNDFEIISKPDGTLNQKIKEKIKWVEKEKIK
jgi:hypothetical protein